MGVTLTVVEDGGTLPAPFLIVVELAKVGNDALARASVGLRAGSAFSGSLMSPARSDASARFSWFAFRPK